MGLAEIQQALKAPKGQENKFGGYRYRSCEDIMEAVKPLLGGCVLTVSDEIVLIGTRYYVRATATLIDYDAGQPYTVTAYAREAETKKGMDEAQITGAASSYARKYALNGLFAIDDTKDADATNDHGKGEQKPTAKPQTKNETYAALAAEVAACENIDTLNEWREKNRTRAKSALSGEELAKLGKLIEATSTALIEKEMKAA